MKHTVKNPARPKLQLWALPFIIGFVVLAVVATSDDPEAQHPSRAQALADMAKALVGKGRHNSVLITALLWVCLLASVAILQLSKRPARR